MKKRLSFLSILLITVQVISQEISKNKAMDVDYGEAINVAGRQRMLSQKLSKAHLLLVLGYDYPVIQEELSNTIIKFEKQLEFLKALNVSGHTQSTITSVEELWIKFKKELEKPYSLSTAKFIIENNIALLGNCNKVVIDLEEDYLKAHTPEQRTKNIDTAASELLQIINISGRQRMLSQRICLQYLASLLFVKQKELLLDHLNVVYDEFDIGIIRLLESEYNNDLVRAEIARLLFFWQNLKNEESKLYSQDFDVGDLYEITNKLTEVFDKITGIYENIYKDAVTTTYLKN